MKNIRFKGWLNAIPFKMTLKIKLTTLLLLVSLFKIQANSYSQHTRLSLNFDEISIGDVFREIEHKSEFRFLYKNREVDINSKVSIHVSKGNIYDILNRIFKDLPIKYEVLDNRQIVLSKQVLQIIKPIESIPVGSLIQQTAVQGSIVDTDGTPLPGASILEKGTTNGTQTDFDGNFSIIVANENATLVISYLGFKTQEIAVNGQLTQSIVLEGDAAGLDEVVVTALGIKRAERTIGYATQRIKGDALKEANETNLVNSLSGKLAGVQVTNTNGGVGGSSSIIIRGIKSVSGNNQPLFVIDGVPISNTNHETTAGFNPPTNPNDDPYDGNQEVDFGNAAGEINPADIESVQVLKGANAAALYGSRAANGVILITTKRGKGQKGLGVSVNSSIAFKSALKSPEFQTEFGLGRNGLYSYGIAGGGVNTNADRNFGPRYNGQLISQYDPTNPSVPISRSWVNRLGSQPLEDFLESGVTLINGFSVSNSSEKGDFRVAYTRHDEQGSVPNTDLTRNSISVNGGINITPRFKIESNITYINGASGNRPGVGAKNNNNIVDILFNTGSNQSLEELSQVWEPFKKNIQQATQIPGNGTNNLYFTAYENDAGNEKNRFYGNINLSYQFTDELSLRLRTGKDYYSDKRTSKLAYSSNGALRGGYNEATVVFDEANSDILLSYAPKLNSDFSVSTIVGANKMFQSTDELRGQTNGGLVTPGFFNLSNSVTVPSAKNYIREKEVNSVYGSATIGYKNYLYLDITGRNDWSSTLPKGNNSYFYPSVSVSAILSDMLDLSSLKVDYLKLRTSYAEVGNDTSPYQTSPLSFDGGDAEGNPVSNVSGTIGNSTLQPENIVSTEIGFETGFLRNRLNFDLTYYNTVNNQQIVQLPLPFESGFGQRVINIPAEISNSGVELTLSGTPIKTDSFKWDVMVNWSKNKNKVSNLNALGDDARIQLVERWINLDIVEGGSFGDFYGDYLIYSNAAGTKFGPKSAERSQQVVRGDGYSWESDDGFPQNLTTEQKPLLGNALPDWVGGINNSFTYKNFNFSFLFDVNYGGEMYSRTYVLGNNKGALIDNVNLITRDSQQAWDGANAAGLNPVQGEHWVQLDNVTVVESGSQDVASGQTIYARSDRYIDKYYDNDAIGTFDRTFLKLRELKLSYNFAEELISKLSMSSASISLFGRNLKVWDDVPHVDPEAAGYNGRIPGGEFMALPSSSTYGLSLNINF